jgi:hypothetical protein
VTPDILTFFMQHLDAFLGWQQAVAGHDTGGADLDMADVALAHELFQIALGHRGPAVVTGINEEDNFLSLDEGLVQEGEKLRGWLNGGD